MSRPVAILLLFVALVLVYALMYAGWSRRARRHPAARSAGVEPTQVVGDDADADTVSAEGFYVSTTSTASRLDRVTAGGLGARARATMRVGRRGVSWEREGAAAVVVPADRVLAVSREAGMAGKVVGRPRIVVVSWRGDPGDHGGGGDGDGDGGGFATGFLPRYAADRDVLVAAVQSLLDGEQARGRASESPARQGKQPDGAP